MYRTWVAIGLAGLLAGVAVVSLFVGFGSPVFLGVAAVSAAAGLLAYRYARERMLRSVYAGVETGSARGAADRTAGDAARGGSGREPRGADDAGDAGDRRRTAQATDGGETTADYADGRGTTDDYDDWTWADSDPDDPFWSDDPEDWEDPWEWEATDPEEAAGNGSRGWRADAGRRDGTGWAGGRRGSAGDRREGAGGPGDSRSGPGGCEDGPTVAEAYETLGLEPGADPGAVRRAYRERAKETHPDCGGDPGAFIRVREAYERLREHLDGEAR